MSPVCNYCANNEELNKIMLYFADMEVSKAYLFRDQSYYGRCVLAFKEHKREFFDLTESEAEAFARDLKRLSGAVSKAVFADKINIGFFGDKVSHMHCHIVPKKEGKRSFGGMFEMSCDPPLYLSEAENENIINKIKENL